MQLARELTSASYTVIARSFERHLSTVLSTVPRAHNLIDQFPEYFDKRQRVVKRLTTREP
jgi:chromosomal replication initiation ATPase DnaA